MADVYPRSPLFEATEGRVTLACRAGGDGTISACSIEAEAPVDLGFGKAALQLAKKIKAGPCAQADDEAIKIPLRFVLPPAPPSREPIFDPRAKTYEGGRLWPAGPYWPEMALRAGRGGTVFLDCKLQPDGRLWPCPFAAASQGGEGFADASRKMAEKGWMKAAPPAPGEVPAPDSIYRIKIIFAPRVL